MFVILLIVVCEWVVFCLLLGCCVINGWCCCYELSGSVNVVSPVWCVLFLFYLCAFQMNPVCAVCVVTYD